MGKLIAKLGRREWWSPRVSLSPSTPPTPCDSLRIGNFQILCSLERDTASHQCYLWHALGEYFQVRQWSKFNEWIDMPIVQIIIWKCQLLGEMSTFRLINCGQVQLPTPAPVQGKCLVLVSSFQGNLSSKTYSLDNSASLSQPKFNLDMSFTISCDF